MLLSDRFLGFFMVPAQGSWNFNFMGKLRSKFQSLHLGDSGLGFAMKADCRARIDFVREIKRLRRLVLLQRKRFIRTELCVRSSVL